MTDAQVDRFYGRLKKDAETAGYHLNPDISFTRELLQGLLVNEQRYGYPTCPCRLASGNEEQDLDIICPCDYRDPDLNDYGACYCALYVSEAVLKKESALSAIPDRRPPPDTKDRQKPGKGQGTLVDPTELPYPVWRCRVCGYLCAREKPPGICPICKATKERFERFI